MDGDLARVAHHLVVLVDVGCAEVDEDVDDEHDVHDEVDDGEWLRVAAFHRRPGLVLLLLGQQEGGGVGREDGRVDDEQEDDPVPHGLEGRVVQQRAAVDTLRLQLVLWNDVRPQRQHLQHAHVSRSQ